MTPPLVLRTAARWATQRTRGWGHGVRAIHRSRQRLSAIGADDGAAARPSAADAGLSLHRYVIGRTVTRRGQIALPRVIMRPQGLGTPPQQVGLAAETRHASRWSNPGTPWDGPAHP